MCIHCATVLCRHAPKCDCVQVRVCPRVHIRGLPQSRGGRSRRFGGLRETKSRLCEGTALAELRPRAPAPALPPDVSCLADLGRACAGARGLRISEEIIASLSAISP